MTSDLLLLASVKETYVLFQVTSGTSGGTPYTKTNWTIGFNSTIGSFTVLQDPSNLGVTLIECDEKMQASSFIVLDSLVVSFNSPVDLTNSFLEIINTLDTEYPPADRFHNRDSLAANGSTYTYTGIKASGVDYTKSNFDIPYPGTFQVKLHYIPV